MLEVAGVLKVAKDELRANYKSGTFPKCNYKFPVKCQKKKLISILLPTVGSQMEEVYPFNTPYLPTNSPILLSY